jgi:hypothetical protein
LFSLQSLAISSHPAQKLETFSLSPFADPSGLMAGINNKLPLLRFHGLVLALCLAFTHTTRADGWLDVFSKKSGTNQTGGSIAGLSQDQVAAGLKEALGNGVQQAISMLGKTNGFLKDASVKIPMPQSLQKVEKSLRAIGQDQLADDFVSTMNRAAEQAVPQAAAVLADSIKQMSIADAKSILTATNNAATEYFRRTSETNLHARFLPIVKTATEKTGVTASYKKMTGASGGGLGGLSSKLFGNQAPDLEDYVTQKALDGLFVKIADQEKQIRQNPAARTTDLLQKVFGAASK